MTQKIHCPDGSRTLLKGLSLLMVLFLMLGLCGCGSLLVPADPVRVIIDERADYLLPLYANGGLKTQPDSIYDQLGLNIEFIIQNDPNACADTVIAGEAVGFGATVSRYAMVHGKLGEAAVEVVMPYIAARGSGADGLVVSGEVKSLNDLPGKKIAVAEHSEARAIVEWLLVNSGMSQKEMDQIRTDMVLCATDADAARTYLEGNADAAGLCEPWLGSCRQEREGTRLIFDTGMSSTLSMTGFLFRSDFLEANVDFMSKFIDGALQARGQYENAALCLKELPAFAALGDDDLLAVARGSAPLSWTENLELLNGAAAERYAEMAEILSPFGINADPGKAQTAFSDTYLQALTETYQGETVPSEEVRWDDQIDVERLLESDDIIFETGIYIEFDGNDPKMWTDVEEALNRYVELAGRMDSTDVYLTIENNIAFRNVDVSTTRDDALYDWSADRANAIKQYFVEQGVDASRILTVGNGRSEVLELYTSAETKIDAVYESEGAEYHTKGLELIEEIENNINRAYSGPLFEWELDKKEKALNAVQLAKAAFEDLESAYIALENASNLLQVTIAEMEYVGCKQVARKELNTLRIINGSALSARIFSQTIISLKVCEGD